MSPMAVLIFIATSPGTTALSTSMPENHPARLVKPATMTTTIAAMEYFHIAFPSRPEGWKIPIIFSVEEFTANG